jgi:alkanesulfonate monooxygenase SsuD/methylene tetrahydromethanopterin reductase-like flavin-dependent oxidoreductase (luciferase family)
VRVCLMIEGQEGVTWEQWKALASACERSGVETMFRSDHYMTMSDQRRGSLDAWSTIAALAAVTSTLRLGTLVSPVTFRHPSLLAKAVVTADHVSGGGRIELGLGAGWFEGEHAAYGFEFPPDNVRMQMLSEQLEMVRFAWGDSAFTMEGEHYSVQDLDALPKPITTPRLLLGGGGGRRSLALAARYADEYNVFQMNEAQLRDVRSGLDDACERLDRDPASLPLSLMDPLERTSTEQAAAKFRQLESVGVRRIMLQHFDHQDLDTVEWIGRELAPALA